MNLLGVLNEIIFFLKTKSSLPCLHLRRVLIQVMPAALGVTGRQIHASHKVLLRKILWFILISCAMPSKFRMFCVFFCFGVQWASLFDPSKTINIKELMVFMKELAMNWWLVIWPVIWFKKREREREHWSYTRTASLISLRTTVMNLQELR